MHLGGQSSILDDQLFLIVLRLFEEYGMMYVPQGPPSTWSAEHMVRRARGPPSTWLSTFTTEENVGGTIPSISPLSSSMNLFLVWEYFLVWECFLFLGVFPFLGAFPFQGVMIFYPIYKKFPF
jgi:hypothetical protein